MSASMNADPDLAVLREDLVALKRDVASLIEHMKGGATNQFRTPPTKLNGACGASANRRERKASARPRQSALFVEKQPFVALMIAVGIGYIGARVLRR